MVVHNLATALTNEGHKVFLVTPYPRRFKVADNYDYAVIRFGFKGIGRLKLVTATAVMTLAYVVKRHKIDVIHVHNVYTPSTWAYYYSKLNPRMPIVGTPHGDDIQITPDIGDGVRLDPAADKVVRRNLAFFNTVTAISPSIRADLEGILENKEKIIDVSNGVWVKNYQGADNKALVRQKYNIPEEAPVVISIGRNHKRKGFPFAIEAIAKLRQSGLPVNYVLVGREMEPLVEQAHALSIADCLITPGQVSADEISQLLQASDIFLSSAIVESFGVTTVEAMSAGLPCVVTDIAGSRDLFSSQFGFMVPAGNSEQIFQKLAYLIQNPTVRADMGRMAREHARRYDWPNVARQYVDVYKQSMVAMA